MISQTVPGVRAMAKISPEQRAAVAEDIRTSGLPRNKIAEKHGISQGSVTNIAKEIGLPDAFDRSATESATRAKALDNRARRANLARRFLEEAERALDDSTGRFLVYSFGGKDNTFNSAELESPPTADRRNLMVIAATAVDKSIAIDRHDAKGEHETIGSLLDDLFGDLQARHGDTPPE